MSAQTATTLVGPRGITQPEERMHRLGLFVLFLVCGLAIIVFGSKHFNLFWTNKNLAYQGPLSVLFLAATVWLKRDERLNRYWPIAFAFFIASSVISVELLLDGWSTRILGWLNLTVSTSQGLATEKVIEMLMVVVPIIVLTKLSGADLGSIYLKRGNLKWGLSIAALVWFNFAASAFLFFATRFTSMDTLGAALLWGLVFSFANGFLEELWLRGIFLRRFQPVLGLGGSVLVTCLVFSLWHGGATYLTPVAIPFMVANTLTLGLACGYLIIKTDSIWGATLIHAAADLFLFIALLANS